MIPIYVMCARDVSDRADESMAISFQVASVCKYENGESLDGGQGREGDDDKA